MKIIAKIRQNYVHMYKSFFEPYMVTLELNHKTIWTKDPNKIERHFISEEAIFLTSRYL